MLAPGGENSGCIRVAVGNLATALTAVGAHIEPELGFHPAATGASLRRWEPGRRDEHSTTPAVGLVGELARKFAPTLVGDGARQVMVGHQVPSGK